MELTEAGQSQSTEIPERQSHNEETRESYQNAAGTMAKEVSLRQQTASKLLFHFSKTFVSVMESTVFAKADSDFDESETDEYFDKFDGFERYGKSYRQLDTHSPQPISDEEFAFDKYFPVEQKPQFRSLFISVAFDIFQSYEYQLIILVRERRKISEIAEDIVHRILDNFKESQRGFNPDYIKPEITRRFLIEKALEHSEPEGITYNSEWSAVEILENPGIVVVGTSELSDTSFCEPLSTKPAASHSTSAEFYQSHWQKNFIGVKKKIGSKYGFRLKFDYETKAGILENFEKVPRSCVSPLYLDYQYCLNSHTLEKVREELDKELIIQDKMKKFGIKGEERIFTDKVKEFQMKLQVQKLEEDINSDKVMKQVLNLSQNFQRLRTKLNTMEKRGILRRDAAGTTENSVMAKSGLLRSNYNVRFEVRDGNADFGQHQYRL